MTSFANFGGAHLQGFLQLTKLHACFVDPLQGVILCKGRSIQLLPLAKVELAEWLQLCFPLCILEPLLCAIASLQSQASMMHFLRS